MTHRYGKPGSFYVTLPSTASINEFPANQANSFKLRLPQRMELEGPHWKVALSGATIPDTTASILDRLGYADLNIPEGDKVTGSVLAKKDLFSIKAITVTDKGGWASTEKIRVEAHDVRSFTAPTGEAFMISVINQLTRGFTYQLNQTKKRLVFNDKRSVPTFSIKGTGDQFVILLDNSKLHMPSNKDRPVLTIRTDLAMKMGWLSREKNEYKIGPNLMPLDNGGLLPTAQAFTKGFTTSSGSIMLFRVRNGNMTLSPAMNWCFTNLNAAYDILRGSPARTLMVYSDVAASSIVGGQTTDLLREIPYNRKERGTMYIEPWHYQFRPIRSNIIETIEVHLSEQDGRLVKFDSNDPSSITLVFKNEIG